MSWKMPTVFDVVFRGLILTLIFGLMVLGVTVRAVNQSRIACFRVDALARYLKAYERVEGKKVERLDNLPSFHLLAPNESLSLKDSDLKQRVADGYVFDYQVLPKDKYVISASPVGLFSPGIEYGITEAGDLRVNRDHVDEDADTHEEVLTWEKIPRAPQIRSAEIPAYTER